MTFTVIRLINCDHSVILYRYLHAYNTMYNVIIVYAGRMFNSISDNYFCLLPSTYLPAQYNTCRLHIIINVYYVYSNNIMCVNIVMAVHCFMY